MLKVRFTLGVQYASILLLDGVFRIRSVWT